jgi:hypothetical protein
MSPVPQQAATTGPQQTKERQRQREHAEWSG